MGTRLFICTAILYELQSLSVQYEETSGTVCWDILPFHTAQSVRAAVYALLPLRLSDAASHRPFSRT